MDPGIEHQQLLTSQKGRRANIMCLLMKNTPPAIVLPKGSNLSLIKPLDPATNLQEVQSSEEHIETVPWICNQQNPDCGEHYRVKGADS